MVVEVVEVEAGGAYDDGDGDNAVVHEFRVLLRNTYPLSQTQQHQRRDLAERYRARDSRSTLIYRARVHGKAAVKTDCANKITDLSLSNQLGLLWDAETSTICSEIQKNRASVCKDDLLYVLLQWRGLGGYVARFSFLERYD